jgi:hypothetical protein
MTALWLSVTASAAVKPANAAVTATSTRLTASTWCSPDRR